jgi:hypothetical protein
MIPRKALAWALVAAASSLLTQGLPAQDDASGSGFRRAKPRPAPARVARADGPAGDEPLVDDDPRFNGKGGDPADELPPEEPLADEDRPARSRPRPADDADPAPAEAMPADFPTEPGQVFRTFDISRYTSLPHDSSNPQDALVEWIFRRTGSAAWHGDRIAVLGASRAQLRAYHSPKVLKQVEEVVERFTNAQPADVIKLRVRFVAASDTRWRYAVMSRLIPIASGPQGQQVYTLDAEDAAMVRTQMQVYQGFKLLLDQERKLINGQTLYVARELPVDYVVGPQRDSAVGLGFQPGTAKLTEGVFLKVSPLLTFEGDALDLALDLRANTVKSLVATKILTRREIGPADMSIDVPEVVESRLNQTIQNWKIGQTLVITGGIHGGILQAKTGFMNMKIPGTVPTKTELLVFLDAEPVGVASPRAAKAKEEAAAPAGRADDGFREAP